MWLSAVYRGIDWSHSHVVPSDLSASVSPDSTIRWLDYHRLSADQNSGFSGNWLVSNSYPEKSKSWTWKGLKMTRINFGRIQTLFRDLIKLSFLGWKSQNFVLDLKNRPKFFCLIIFSNKNRIFWLSLELSLRSTPVFLDPGRVQIWKNQTQSLWRFSPVDLDIVSNRVFITVVNRKWWFYFIW